jgi:hypothetical protein
VKFKEYIDFSQVLGYYASRKYNGYGVLYKHKERKLETDKFVYYPPKYWCDELPQIDMYGELWHFDLLYSVSNHLAKSDWHLLKFIPYSHLTEPFEKFKKDYLDKIADTKYFNIPNFKKVLSVSDTLITPNTEGNVYVHPNYVHDWSNKVTNLAIKHKPLYEHEATVVGYEAGKTGKNIGKVGALRLQIVWKPRVIDMFGGKESFVGKLVNFNSGSGLSDWERTPEVTLSRFPIGTVVSMHFFGITHLGSPIHSKIGERICLPNQKL